MVDVLSAVPAFTNVQKRTIWRYIMVHILRLIMLKKNICLCPVNLKLPAEAHYLEIYNGTRSTVDYIEE